MFEQRYEFELVGQSPLLLHWDNIEWADAIEERRTKIKEEDKGNFKAGDDRCPPETWKGYCYNDGTHIALPNDNLRTCMLKASARITLEGKKTFKELSQAGLLFDDFFVNLYQRGKQIKWADVDAIAGTFKEQSDAVKQLGFSLLVKRARVGQTKHVRVRAMLNDWKVVGTLTIIDEQWKDEILRRAWNIAGVYIGLCDWRPGSPKSPGPYGRFDAALKKL